MDHGDFVHVECSVYDKGNIAIWDPMFSDIDISNHSNVSDDSRKLLLLGHIENKSALFQLLAYAKHVTMTS